MTRLVALDDDAGDRPGLCVDLPLYCGRSQAIPAFSIRRRLSRVNAPATQSGEVDRVGRITKVGDGETRTALFEAANVVLRPSTRWSPMKAWAVRVAHRQGSKRAKVALARKMAVVLHRMWVDGTEFRWTAVA